MSLEGWLVLTPQVYFFKYQMTYVLKYLIILTVHYMYMLYYYYVSKSLLIILVTFHRQIQTTPAAPPYLDLTQFELRSPRDICKL